MAPASSRRCAGRARRAARAVTRPVCNEPLEPRLFLAAQLLGDLNAESIGSGVDYGWRAATRDTVHVGDASFFVANDGVHGHELWKIDRPAGTVSLVRDLAPGPRSSDPLELRAFGGALYFFAKDATDRFRLFRTDGTAAGTLDVSGGVEAFTIYNRSDLTTTGPLVASGGYLYF